MTSAEKSEKISDLSLDLQLILQQLRDLGATESLIQTGIYAQTLAVGLIKTGK